ncbi:MAG: NCS2 family permease, partial [Oceanospirillales bacterium]|nr:NCS2 family permease [Oceanospirillales bacterium]
MLDKLFKLSEHQTTVKTEVIAGLTTFLTMIYVIFVNPTVLSGTGMDAGAVFVATCLAAAIGCFVMGFWANYPIALAPGMGLNAFFSLTVVGQMGYSWETALGAVFISGICFFLLSIFRIREWIINSIPMSLKGGIGAGIGLFLGFIGLKNAGIVTDDTHTLVTIGDMSQWGPVMASLGFIIIATLYYRKVTGSVMIGILAITLLSLATGHVEFKGIASAPPSL